MLVAPVLEAVYERCTTSQGNCFWLLSENQNFFKNIVIINTIFAFVLFTIALIMCWLGVKYQITCLVTRPDIIISDNCNGWLCVKHQVTHIILFTLILLKQVKWQQKSGGEGGILYYFPL